MSKQKNVILILLALVLANVSNVAEARTWVGFFSGEEKDADLTKYVEPDDPWNKRSDETINRYVNPCNANNCVTYDGFLNCIEKDLDYAKYADPSKFFRRTETGAFLERDVMVPVGTRKIATSDDPEDDSADREIITASRRIKIVSPHAYKAFVKVARRNPHCFRFFCRRNCLTSTSVDPRVVENQAKQLAARAFDLQFGSKTYTPEMLKTWASEYPEKLKNLAHQFILRKLNAITTTKCISETDKGVKMRMFCSQCEEAMPAGERGLVNRACQVFDATINVDTGMLEQELDEEYMADQAQKRKERQRQEAEDEEMSAQEKKDRKKAQDKQAEEDAAKREEDRRKQQEMNDWLKDHPGKKAEDWIRDHTGGWFS